MINGFNDPLTGEIKYYTETETEKVAEQKLASEQNDGIAFKCTQTHIDQLRQAMGTTSDKYDDKTYKAALNYTEGDLNKAMYELLP